jgi:hypothetical protein
MARLAGFEPTTPWFVAKYSIHLSYRREARIITEARVAPLALRQRSDGAPRIVPPQRHIPGIALAARASFDYPYANTRLHPIRPEPIR